jgi:hypothetical protein
MRISSLLRPRHLAVLLVLAAPFVPRTPDPVERNAALDIELVRSAECEYKGITASFEDLTRAYALKVYEDPHFEGWEARPNPHHPETEALVAGRFTVKGVRPGAPDARRAELRRDAGDDLAVTWLLNGMAGVRVTPHDEYARDAIEVFSHTVDDMLRRMVFVTQPSTLRHSPDASADSLRSLDVGQVLLREQRDGGWLYVRIPSTRTRGWVDSAVVARVNDR